MTVRLVELSERRDARGALCFAESPDQVPFAIRRIFHLYDLPQGGHRGGHAHKECHQMFLCLAGRVELAAAWPEGSGTFVLDTPRKALYLPPLSWVDIRVLDGGSICLCLASHTYDADDYIHDRAEFEALSRASRPS